MKYVAILNWKQIKFFIAVSQCNWVSGVDARVDTYEAEIAADSII
jgi:hypothetical protein